MNFFSSLSLELKFESRYPLEKTFTLIGLNVDILPSLLYSTVNFLYKTLKNTRKHPSIILFHASYCITRFGYLILPFHDQFVSIFRLILVA